MNDTFEPRRRWPWVLLLLAALFALLVFGGHWVWSTGAERRLARQVAAYHAAGEPIELADLNVTDVADSDNAALDLLAAAQSIGTTTERFKTYDALDAALPLTDKEAVAIAAIVADNKTAFDDVDLAMTRKGVDWKIVFRSPAITTLLPHLTGQRVLAQLIRHHALLAHQKGDDAAAVLDIKRLLFAADALNIQPVLVTDLVATGIRSLATDCAQEIASDMRIAPLAGAAAAGGTSAGAASPEQIKQLIASLLDERAARAGQRAALLGERALELDIARCIANGTLSPSNLQSGMPTPPSPASTAVGYAARPIALDDGLLMIRYTSAAEQAASKASNWPAFVASAPPIPPEMMSAPYRHVVMRLALPSFDRAIQTNFRASADRRMAAIALATALYRADHAGKFPAKLEELVPTYLPAIPADPMSAAGAIKYVSATTQPIVYSVGENGTDEGGNPASMTRSPAKSKWAMLDAITYLTRQQRPPPDSDDTLSGVDAESLQPAATQPATQSSNTPPPTSMPAAPAH